MTNKELMTDEEYFNLSSLIVKGTGEKMRTSQFDTTLETNEGVIVNGYSTIVGVQKTVYNKKDSTRRYLFEVMKTFDGRYRVVVEDNNRGVRATYYTKDMKELDELMKDNNPFTDVDYNLIGNIYKRS